MPKLSLDFANDTYQSFSPALAGRRMINMYRQVPEGPALNQAALFGSPGLSQHVDTGSNSCRGMFETKGRGFAVYGGTLFEFFSGGTASSRGSINGSGAVKFASNGFVIVIITNIGGYFYDLSTDVLTIITDSVFTTSFGTVKDVTYKDGFFAYMTEDYIFNGTVLTDNDGRSFDGLSFGSAEIEPDGNVAIHNSHNQLYVLGANTIEIFETIGGTNFPFQRIKGATIQKGCVARDSVVDFQSMMSFLGNEEGESPALFLVLGSQVQRISTPAIEAYIQTLSKNVVDDATCWVYQQAGSPFLVLDVGDATFVYDYRASQRSGRNIWHERQSGEIDWENYKEWRAKYSVSVFGKIFVGDKTTSDIGEVDYDVYTEYGNRIRRGFTTQPFGEGEETHLTEIEVVAQVGVGNSTITNPQLEFSYSDDQRAGWSVPVKRELGADGDYDQRLIWRRLGMFDRNRILRFYTDDPVKIAILRVEATIGNG